MIDLCQRSKGKTCCFVTPHIADEMEIETIGGDMVKHVFQRRAPQGKESTLLGGRNHKGFFFPSCSKLSWLELTVAVLIGGQIQSDGETGKVLQCRRAKAEQNHQIVDGLWSKEEPVARVKSRCNVVVKPLAGQHEAMACLEICSMI